jgi:hypothetical protein
MILELDLVPLTSFYKNARAAITKKQWGTIRSVVISKAYDLCEICGLASDKPLDAHEVWEYTNDIQKLIKIIALDKNCHAVKHFGLAELRGNRAAALNHLMKINKIDSFQAEKHIEKSFNIWAERSEKIWKLDLSHLEEYGINVEKIKKT